MPSSPPQSGRLIVFEGVEGSGKTTQIKWLQAWLETEATRQLRDPAGNKLAVIVTRQPGGTALGQQIRQLLLHSEIEEPIQDRTELLLYAADRAQHVEEQIKPALAQGQLILCDRYTDSTIAYQSYGRGLDRALIHQLNHIATDGLQSDLTIWLDLEIEVGLERARQRGQIDRMEQADLAFHRRVQQGYRELAQQYPDRIVRVDASPSEAVVAQQIQAMLLPWLHAWYPPLHP